MLQLQEATRGDCGIKGCFLAEWGVGGRSREDLHCQRVWSLSSEGKLQAYDLEESTASAVQAHIALPVEDSILVAAIYSLVGAGTVLCMALGTRAGSVFLLERLSDPPSGTYSLESWDVSAQALQAHAAPVDGAVWNSDGSLLVTAAANGSAWVTALCWEWGNQSVLLAAGEWITLTKLQHFCRNVQCQETNGDKAAENAEVKSWKAHPRGITSADWAPVSAGMIVSTGCDWTCRIWDAEGVLLRSMPTEHLSVSPRAWLPSDGFRRGDGSWEKLGTQGHPTAVAWSSLGEYFVIGAGGSLVLCSARGEVLDIATLLHVNFVFALRWASDSLQFAAACGSSGFYCFKVKVIRRDSWRYRTTMEGHNILKIEENASMRRAPIAIETSQPPQEVFVGRGAVCYSDSNALHVTGKWQQRLQINDARSGNFTEEYLHCCEIKEAANGDRCHIAIRDAKGALLISEAKRLGTIKAKH
ncbi:intraflagellar transport protein [Cyclospora cayetanensis]|uniref:Intraflagellar transport protein n=1 Tax=Cyclospora cayetanensis TaxID=88456 RepID=A0A1D3D681_9EIME|nr:intraflagellar transport protein [Cyclospora cayetanensis]